ncbi:MAG: hypothetical protein DWQ01_19025 [Planctomycetota bacterium]|nr:MAG: hypothetical protein DWQ01_19025 [Planctomycetota bacterium]
MSLFNSEQESDGILKVSKATQQALLRWKLSLDSGCNSSMEKFLSQEKQEVRSEILRLSKDFEFIRSFVHGENFLEPEGKIGEFHLVRELGRGAMGVVWEANHPKLDRRVALKFLPSRFGISEQEIDRFRQEAVAASGIHHPGIVQVFDFCQEKGQYFIVQELVPGGSNLEDFYFNHARISSRKHVDWKPVVELFEEIAQALHFAHGLGILHRDIKPQNILIHQDGSPKIADFGLAELQNRSGSKKKWELVGTPYYMAPEQIQCRGEAMDGRADLFSLAVVFYEFLCLERPFEAGNSSEVMAKILHQEARSPRKVNKKVPLELDLICMRGLEKNVNRRYKNCQAFADDLRRWRFHQPIHARPSSFVLKSRKWIRRHPIQGLSAMAILVVVAYSLISQWQLSRSRSQVLAGALVEESIQIGKSDPAKSLALLVAAGRASPQIANADRFLRSLENCHEHLQLSGHAGDVEFTFFHPNQKYGITFATDGKGRVWDLTTGLCVKILRGHKGVVKAATLDPAGRWLVSGCGKGRVICWDLKTFEPVQQKKLIHGEIRQLLFNDKSSLLLIVGSAGRAYLWDCASWQVMSSYSESISEGILSGSWLPGGERFSLVYQLKPNRGLIQFYQVGSTEAIASMSDQKWATLKVDFHPSKPWMLSSDRDHVARLWRVPDQKLLAEFSGHQAEVSGAKFHPSKDRILTWSPDGTLKIWDLNRGELVRDLRGHSNKIRYAKFICGGEQVISCSTDGTVRIWDAESGQELQILSGHEAAVLNFAVDHSGQQVLTGSIDNTARLFKKVPILDSLGITRSELSGGSVLSMHPSEEAVLVGTEEGICLEYSLPNFEELSAGIRRQFPVVQAQFDRSGDCRFLAWKDGYFLVQTRSQSTSGSDRNRWKENPVEGQSRRKMAQGACMDLDGRFLVITYSRIRGSNYITQAEIQGDYPAEVYSAETGLLMRELNIRGRAAKFNAAGDRLLIIGLEGEIALYEVPSWREIYRGKLHHHRVAEGDFSEQKDFLVLGSADATLSLLDSRSGEKIREYKPKRDHVICLDFNPTGTEFLAGHIGGSLILYPTQKGAERRFTSVRSKVIQVGFSPDQQWLAAVYLGGGFRVWMRDRSDPVLTLDNPSYSVKSFRFSKDSRFCLLHDSNGRLLYLPLYNEDWLEAAERLCPEQLSEEEIQAFKTRL